MAQGNTRPADKPAHMLPEGGAGGAGASKSNGLAEGDRERGLVPPLPGPVKCCHAIIVRRSVKGDVHQEAG